MTATAAFHTVRTMKNAFAAFLIVAMVATCALIALDLLASQSGGPPLIAAGTGVATEADRARIVQSFYDAANAEQAGQEPWSLSAVVSPEVEVHLAPGRTAFGLGALREHLAQSGKGGPTRRSLVRLIDDGIEVAALIESRAPAQPDGRSDSGASSLLWRTVDLFHIERGMITAYWPGAPGEPPAASLPEVDVPVTQGDVGVSLTRLELGPDVAAVSLHAALPHLFLAEHGSFAATGETTVYVAFAGERQFSRLQLSGRAAELVLHSGDALFMPDGNGPAISAAGDSVAKGLSVLIAPRARIDNLVSPHPRDLVTVMGMHDATHVDIPFTWENGAVTETLAVAMLPATVAAADRLRLSGVPLHIEPGQRQTHLPESGFCFAVLRTGSLRATDAFEAPASAGSTHSPGVAGPAAPNIPNKAQPDDIASRERLLSAGEAFAIQPGDNPILANLGMTAADLLLIEIAAPTAP